MFEDIASFRHEHKYVMSEPELVAIEHRLQAFLSKDSHVSEAGGYGVRSMYFDDYHDRFLQESIDGVDERMKWRIRIYDQNTGHIGLERKIRKGDLISKQSCVLDINMYSLIIERKCKVGEENPPLLNLFIEEMTTKALSPAIIVEYERTPFVCASGNIRITIDRNIRSSNELDAFMDDRPLASRPVLLSGQNLLEVKYDAFLPDHIAHVIEHGRMRRETFSKYYLARKFQYKGCLPIKTRRVL